VLAQKIGALARFGDCLGILVDFWSVWNGLGAFCKYISDVEGPVISLPNTQGLRHNSQQSQGPPWTTVGIYGVQELFLNGKTRGPGP
jgi:hypothetical protein